MMVDWGLPTVLIASLCFSLDIDECESPEGKCDLNANCFNSPGSYRCRCRLGYQGNGTHCICEFLYSLKFELFLAKKNTLKFPVQFTKKKYEFSFLADGTCDGVVCGQNSACIPRSDGSRERQCVCVDGWTGDGRSCFGNVTKIITDINIY